MACFFLRLLFEAGVEEGRPLSTLCHQSNIQGPQPLWCYFMQWLGSNLTNFTRAVVQSVRHLSDTLAELEQWDIAYKYFCVKMLKE